MTATQRSKHLHTLFVYTWVSVFNIVILAGLWFVSPLGYKKLNAAAIGFIPSAPIDRTTFAPSVITGDPTHISVASLGIDLSVQPGVYNPATQTWNIAADAAQFATVSMPLNTNTGNTLLYGHNNKKVFYNIRKITPGTTLIVNTNNGYIFRYEFVSHKDVEPNDLSVFKFDGAPTVTIQTCTGNWNETRGMYLFKLTGVQKA